MVNRMIWRRLIFMLAVTSWLLCNNTQMGHALGPNLSALSSLVLPGSGQLSNDAYLSGGLQLGTDLVLRSYINQLKRREDYTTRRFREDTNELDVNHTTLQVDTLSVFRFNVLAFYSGYDAYRLARSLPEYRVNYSRTPVPSENLGDLSLAPLRWRNFTHWTVYVPLALAASVAFSNPVENQDPSQSGFHYRREGGLSRRTLRGHHFASFYGVGVGEEAFFRGYLNTEFVEYWGPKWGVTMSSLVFGSLHTGSGGSASATFAMVYGLYVGWMHVSNDYSLQRVTALHSWWDVLVSLSASRDPEAQEVTIPLFNYVHTFF